MSNHLAFQMTTPDFFYTPILLGCGGWRPEETIGYFNSKEKNYVELMSCGQTDPAVIELLVERLPGYGLTPYVVQRESMGFIFNRIWAAIKRETLAVVAEGVASPQVVDAIYTQATGAHTGPLRLMDAVGLDVVLSIEENYARHRPGLPEAPRDLLKAMISEGRLGVKSGRGFYDYRRADSEAR